MTYRLAAGAAVLVLALTGCAEDEDPATAPAAEAPGEATVDAEVVSLASALAQVRGHHRVALELYSENDHDGASTHSAHPVAELLPLLTTELEEHGGDVAALEGAIQSVNDAIAKDEGVEAARSAIDDAAAETETALAALVDDPADPAFVGSTIASLLGTAGHEYEEAVAGDGIELVAEYQDGYAFVAEAEEMYDTLRADIESDEPEEAEEIEEAFGILTNAFATASPPEDPIAVEDVVNAAALVGHELEETVGAEVVEDSDPDEIVERIEGLLDEIEAAYAAGDADEASELAAEAYLENYEVIEADVIELAPEINEELEPLLGAELRRQMEAGASEEEIGEMIARAKELLGQALAAIEEAE